MRVGLERVMPPEWRGGLVSRTRLLKALERGVLLGKVTAIVAPGGYGKSVLLADFARHSAHVCSWLRLDDSDRDPPQLLRSLSAAINRPVEPAGAVVRELRASEWDEQGDAPVTELMIANRLLHPAGVRVLIMDDFHTIADSGPAVHTIVEILVRAGDNVRLVVASRTELPEAFTDGALLHESSAPIDANTLRFDHTDTESLFDALDVPLESWQSLHDRLSGCEGWPSAVMMALRSIQFGSAGQLRVGGTSFALFDLLADQVVQRLEPDERRFLFEIANLERITPDLCVACTTTDRPRERLQRLIRVTPFLEFRPADDNYRLHALVRRYLRSHSDGRRDFTKSQHKLAATWFHENGEDVAEIRHLISAGDLVAAASRIEEVASELTFVARWHALLGLIKRLETAGGDLSVSLAHSKARAQVAVGDAAGAVSTISHALTNTSPDTESVVELLLSRSYAYRFRGEHDQAVADAKEALDHIAILTPPQRIKALRILASSYAYNLELLESRQLLREARRLADEYDVAPQRVLVRSAQAIDMYIAGKPLSAVDCVREAVALADEFEYVEGRLYSMNNLGIAQHLAGAYADAFATFDASLGLARRLNHPRIECFSWLGRGDVHTDLGQFDSAMPCYARGLSLARAISETELAGHALRSLSTMHRQQGDLPESRKAIADLFALGLSDKLARAQGHIAHGALCIAEDRFPQGIGALTDAVLALAETDALVELTKSKLLLADALFRHEGIAAAVPHLQDCVALMERTETNAFLVPLASHMPRLWGVAEGEGLGHIKPVLSEPDLRPLVGPGVRGLPRSARVDDPHPELLTPREREIILALCEGLTRDEVASRIGRSRSTVDKTVSLIYASTGFSSAHQLVAWAVRCGMFPPASETPG